MRDPRLRTELPPCCPRRCLGGALLVLTAVLSSTGTAMADPPAAETTQLVAQLGHERLTLGGLNAVAFSPLGNLLVTGSADGSASMWDGRTGAQVRRFVTGGGSLASLALTRDGSRILLGSDAKVIVIDVQTGNEVRRLEWQGPQPGNNYPANGMAVSHDGATLAVATYEEAILWNLASGEILARFKHPGMRHVQAVAFSSDDKRLLTGCQGASVWMWDIATATNVQKYKVDAAAVSVAFTPDAQRILVGTYRTGVHGLDVATGKELWHYTGPSSDRALGCSPDGQTVMTGRALLDAATGAELKRFGERTLTAVAFSAGGSMLFAGNTVDNTAWIWNVKTGEELIRFEGLTNAVTSVAWSRDGKRILTAGRDDKAHLWNLESGQESRRLEEQGTKSGTHNYPTNRWSEYAGLVESAEFSPDGRQVLTGGKDGRVILWDATTGTEVRRFVGHRGAVWSVAFSPDGLRAMTGGGDEEKRDPENGALRLWDVATGREVRRFQGQEAQVTSVAFSSDGKGVVTASLYDMTVRVWDAATGRELRRFEHQTNASEAKFSPDGRRVLVANWGGIALLDVQTGQAVWQKDGFNPYRVAFSPDGSQVVVAQRPSDKDWSPVLYDAATGAELRRFKGHTAFVSAVTFSPDGKRLLTGGSDHTARVWDVATGHELARMLTFKDGTWAVMDSKGRFDASNGGDVKGLHWVVGMEPIELSQLKARYYEPRLLAKILGFDAEAARDVASIQEKSVDLYPAITVTQAPGAEKLTLGLHLENRGGGIGAVQVLVNGKEFVEDARPKGAAQDVRVLDVAVDLSSCPLLMSGQRNMIGVVAYNGSGWLASPVQAVEITAADSRGLKLVHAARPENPTPPDSATSSVEGPTLWAIVAGVSNYRGDIKLRFSSKDAEDFANALEIAARGLYKGIQIRRLNDVSGTPATRRNLDAAFESLKQASPSDVLVVYLAGHGVNLGTGDTQYYYLLQDATGLADLEDPALRETMAISAAELTDKIKQVPALKQLLILDTCASGKLIASLSGGRAVSSSQARALDRMKDRTGMFILAGSAADAVSYESSGYGQGLLTYSLLEGMKGTALRDREFVDVENLVNYAVDRVPQLASEIMGIQQPTKALPRGGQSFDIGELSPAAQGQIPLAQQRPIVLAAKLQEEQSMLDELELGKAVDEALRDAASDRSAPFVFLQADKFTNAYMLGGRYTINGDDISLTVKVRRENSEVGSFTVQGSKSALGRLASEVVERTKQAIAAPGAAH